MFTAENGRYTAAYTGHVHGPFTDVYMAVIGRITAVYTYIPVLVP